MPPNVAEGLEHAPLIRLRAEGVSWAPTDGGDIVVLDHLAGTYISANATAATLWRLLERGSTRESLVGALVEQFGVDLATAQADVEDFVRDLRARNLLMPSP